MATTDNSPTAPSPTAPSPTAPSPTAPSPTAPSPTAPTAPVGPPAGRLSVSKAFGKPITAQGRTIIPVALVAMGNDGGLWNRMKTLLNKATAEQFPASAANGSAASPAGQGPGSPMRRMVVRPVGYIDLSSTGSRFVTIAPGRYVALGFALAFVVGGLIRSRRKKSAKR